MDSITMELDYTRYLEACIEEQFDMERCVHEALALSESFDEFKNLESFTEAAAGKIKATWEKFKAWIKRAWAKFLERLSNFGKDNQGYLTKYKDIILTKKPKEGYTIEIANHEVGIQRIYQTKVEAITAQELESMNTAAINAIHTGENITLWTNKEGAQYDQSEGVKYMRGYQTLIKAMSDAGVKDPADSENVKTTFTQYFLGGAPRTISTTDPTLNMKDMYDWCWSADKAKKAFEADAKQFENNCTIIMNNFDAAAREIEKEVAANKQTTTATDTEKGTETGNTTPTADEKKAEELSHQAEVHDSNSEKLKSDNSAAYSQLYGGMIYVSEADAPVRQQVAAAATGTTTQAAGGNSDAYVKYAKGGTVKGQFSSNADTEKVARSGGRMAAAGYDKFNDYLKYMQGLMNFYKTRVGFMYSAKANAIIQISKDYMALIRAHVQDYIGTPDNVADNQPAATNRLKPTSSVSDEERAKRNTIAPDQQPAQA